MNFVTDPSEYLEFSSEDSDMFAPINLGSRTKEIKLNFSFGPAMISKFLLTYVIAFQSSILHGHVRELPGVARGNPER